MATMLSIAKKSHNNHKKYNYVNYFKYRYYYYDDNYTYY